MTDSEERARMAVLAVRCWFESSIDIRIDTYIEFLNREPFLNVSG